MSQADETRKQADVLAGYLPPGRAFGAKHTPGTVTRSLLEGLAEELRRGGEAIETFKREVLPSETTELLAEWERAVGIPDECFDGEGTVKERRDMVIAKIASLGVQTAQDFVDLAALFGVDAAIVAGSVHGVFPYTFPIIFFPNAKAAYHTIIVDFGNTGVATFPFTFPILFGSKEQAMVECLFRKVKPAHCDLLFFDLPNLP